MSPSRLSARERRLLFAFAAATLLGIVDFSARPPLGNREARRKRFRSERVASGAVAFAGDSIIQRWDSLEAEFSDFRAVNRGIDGDTSADLLERLGEDVLSVDPGAVVLLVGTNDLRPGWDAARIAASVERLVDALRGRRLVLCEILPRNRQPDGTDDRVRLVNTRLREMAKRSGAVLCPTYGAFVRGDGTPLSGAFSDGVHPNAGGYKLLSRAVRGCLERSLRGRSAAGTLDLVAH